MIHHCTGKSLISTGHCTVKSLRFLAPPVKRYEKKRNDRQIVEDEETIRRLEEVRDLIDFSDIDTLDSAYFVTKKLRYNYKKEWDEFKLVLHSKLFC